MSRFALSILSFALFINSTVYAQKSFYLGLNVCYSVPVGGSTNSDITYTTYSNSANSTATSKYNPFNLGQGFSPNLQFGYYFNNNLGIELGLGYYIGNYSTSSTYILNNSSSIRSAAISNNSNTNEYYSKTTYKYSSLYLNPSIVVKLPFNKINPFIKMGPYLGVLNTLNKNLSTDFPYEFKTEEIIEGGIAFGFNSSLGIEYKFSDYFGFYIECAFKYVDYSPSQYSSTTNYSDGSSTSISGNYSNNSVQATNWPGFNSVYNTNANPNRPIQNMPLNSIGFTIGTRYYLFKK